MSELTAERLRELLHYQPETGVFSWRSRSNGRVPGGATAGTLSTRGYIQIKVAGKKHYAHRLAWLYVHREWPKDQLDHRDGDRKNNRLVNLREATSFENQQNKSVYRSNSSGLVGASWHKARKAWQSQIKVSNRIVYLGIYPTAEEAHAVYLAAKADLHTFQPTPRKTTTKASNDQNYQAAARG